MTFYLYASSLDEVSKFEKRLTSALGVISLEFLTFISIAGCFSSNNTISSCQFWQAIHKDVLSPS